MNDIIEAEPRAVVAAPDLPAGPMGEALAFIRAGGTMEQAREMMALQKEWKAEQARDAYYAAVAEFKRNPPTVYKDKDNAQFKSRYTSIGNLVNTVNVALSAHGLTAHWDIDQADRIKVTCTLSHRLGHSGSCSMEGPPDTSGAKNPLQQIKSTVTYLKLATYEAITGIASSEGNADDDGNGAISNAYDPAATLSEWTIRAEAAINIEALNKTRKMAGVEFSAAGDVKGWDAFKAVVETKRDALKAAA